MKAMGGALWTGLLGKLVGEVHTKNESESVSTMSESSLDDVTSALEGMSLNENGNCVAVMVADGPCTVDVQMGFEPRK